MRYFFTLYRLRLKATLGSQTALVSVLFLALTLGFALLLPGKAPAALSIGVLPQGEIARKAAEILQNNGDYTVTAYEEPEALQADVLSGKLHCGYEISSERDLEKPVTVYYTEASYLRPLLDQLVLSAYFEANMPRLTQQFLDEKGYEGADALKLLEKQRQEAKTMSVELRAVGRETPLPEASSQNMQPLLYAVLVSLFLAVTFVEALLVPGPVARAQKQLRVLSGHGAASVAAPVLARLTIYLAVLLAADAALTAIWGGMYYPRLARLTMLQLLALAGALPALAANFLRKHTFVVAMLPPLLLVSVFCSGALIDPKQFPMGLAALRFLSPAWYALRWMAFF